MVREYERDNSENIINIEEILKFLLRNFQRISFFSIIGFFSAILVIVGNKKIFTGQFQIVLEEETNTSLSDAKSAFEVLLGQSSVGKSLQTELEILKSPFVLLNVFEFIQKYDPFYSKSQLTFDDWSKQIKAKFKSSTSVLNIKYQDQNKDNILPVLKKISEKYQDYSGRKRRRELELSLNYFKKQINIYKEKSIKSIKESDDFATKYDLLFLKESSNNSNFNSAIGNSNSYSKVLNVENKRIEESSRIREINELIESIKSNKNNYEKIIYLSSIIRNTYFENNSTISELEESIYDIDLELTNLRKIYNENEKTIQDNLKIKENLIERLYIQTFNSLLALKEKSEASLKSLERPIGVISKYKELIRTANKNELLLTQLEDQLRIFSLEEAKYKDPWQLITKPKLDKFPKPEFKLRKLLIGLLAGLVTGSLISKFIEKKRNKIITESDIKEIFKDIWIETFEVSDKDTWQESIAFFSIFLANFKGEIPLINIDIMDKEDIRNIVDLLNQNLKSLKIISTNSISEGFEKNNFLISIETSQSSIEKLEKINKNITLQNKKLVGIIFINKEYKFKNFYFLKYLSQLKIN